MTESIALFLDATYGHLLNAIFLGLVPVLVITLFLCAVAFAFKNVRVNRALLGVIFLFSVTGAVLGLLLGASREPAVQAFLPALITLLAGVIFYALPKEDSLISFESLLKQESRPEGNPSEFKAEFVVASITALMIAAAMGSFWGGSIRGIKERSLQDYEEWRIQYEQIQIPANAQKLGIIKKPLDAPVKGKSKP